MSNQDTIYLKNIHIKNTEIREDTVRIRGQLDTIIAQGGGGGGSTGLNLESTQLEVLSGITGGFATLHNDLTNQLTVNLVDVSGLASQATLSDTYNLLNDNIGTGGMSVSIKALNGDEITNTVIDTKRGLDTNIINNLSVNILDTNPTIYDLTDNSAVMTENDTRFEADRVRPDSWHFDTSKGQAGSNIYWYSNTSTSPLGVQQFNITHGDLSSLYSVVSINKTENNNRLPFMALYSPSTVAFYTSRWVYTIDTTEQLIQTEKILVYFNNDPVDIFTNLRHVRLLKNVIASQGPQLETEIIFLMSINTASGEPAGSISYNAYNAGWFLNNGVHNDFQFNSGIDSKGELLLSNLNLAPDAVSLAVAVSNQVTVANTSLEAMSFTTGGTNSLLNVINGFDTVVNAYDLVDIDVDDNLPIVDMRNYSKISVFGYSETSGMAPIQIQYSTDGTTFYTSSNTIWTSNAQPFSWDNNSLAVPYLRFHLQQEYTVFKFNVCRK
jgi:hypothetical protein